MTSENVPQSVNKRPRHVNEVSALLGKGTQSNVYSFQPFLSCIYLTLMCVLDVGLTTSNLWSSALTQPCITSQRNPPQYSDWPVSPYSTLNGQMVFQVEQKKHETTGCRLFGIDLMSPSMLASEEKTALMRPINVNKPDLDSNTDPKSEISKLSEEKKQEPAQASPKEVQSKQISSSRSRTKVCM